MARISVLSGCVLALVVVATVPTWADDAERNQEVVRRMFEAINGRDFAALEGVVADDVVRHSAATPGVEVRNREEFVAYLRQDLAAVPDSRQEIDQLLAQGDRVAIRAVYRGTQTGSMGPFPPSGKPMELPFLGILRIEDGKVAEIWVEWDNLAALTQLGHFPTPETPQAVPALATDVVGETSADAAKAVARRWFEEVINQRDLDAIADIYTPAYVHHGPEGAELRGHDAVRAFAAAILAASDDRRAVVEQQVIEDDLVVTRFSSRGRHSGPFRGVEPTGEIWTTEGIVISRIENGKIAEDWEVIHISGL